MNSTLPEPNANASAFANSKKLLMRIAVGLGLYSLLVLYPAFVWLHYIYSGNLPTVTTIAAVSGCTILFVWFCLWQMADLSPPTESQEKSS